MGSFACLFPNRDMLIIRNLYFHTGSDGIAGDTKRSLDPA